MKIEFCEPNYCDVNINPDTVVELIPTSKWYQDDIKFLYDHNPGRVSDGISYKRLYSTGSDDSSFVRIDVDFGSDVDIDTIKFLGFNWKSFLVRYKEDGESFFVDVEPIKYGCDTTSYHIFDDTLPKFRYLTIYIYTTQIPDAEKYLGELYVGKRRSKLETGKVTAYRVNSSNPRESTVRDYLGFRRKNRIGPVFNFAMVISRPDQATADFYADMELYGGMYDFFPASDNVIALDPHINMDQVFLVEAAGTYNREPYGTNAKGIVNLNLMETKYIA